MDNWYDMYMSAFSSKDTIYIVYSLLYLILLSSIRRWFIMMGKLVFEVGKRFSDRTTEPMAFHVWKISCYNIFIQDTIQQQLTHKKSKRSSGSNHILTQHTDGAFVTCTKSTIIQVNNKTWKLSTCFFMVQFTSWD